MKLKLTRKEYTTSSTIGDLAVNGKFQCHTLEDPVRPEKIKGDTAIPAGVYNVVIGWSPRFQRDLPLLENVPNFEGIRIHAGNTAADTEGCLLVGQSKATDFIGSSRAALAELLPLLKAELDGGGKVEIEIVEGGVSPFKQIAAAAGTRYRVTADPLRMRSAADTTSDANIVARLPFGSVVTAAGQAPEGWRKVAATVDGANKTGFVAGKFLEALPPAPAGDLFRVNVDSLRLRTAPAVLTDDTIIASLPRQQLVARIAVSNKPMWWEVETVVNGTTRRGFVNSGMLVPEAVAPTPTYDTATGEVQVGERALQLILDFEGMDQPGKWPGQASGISLGHGYDLGYYTHDEFMGDWGPYLTEAVLARLAKAIGRRGTAAKNLAPSFADIRVTKAAADAVFMNRTIPKIKTWALKTFPGILNLPPEAQGALTSLVYNRGTDMQGDRRLEMRLIRDCVADPTTTVAAKLTRIAALLRDMKRHWPKTDGASGHPGIRRRREAEAVLVETAG